MVGACLACALGDGPFKVALLDRRAGAPPQEDYDLRVSAITLASRRIFENLGAWDDMRRRRVTPVAAMHVWDQGGSGSIDFDAAEIGEACLAYIVENSVIHAALLERLQQFTNVHYLCPVEVADIALAEAAAVVRLADARMLEARLVVGADGADSPVRRAAGITTQGLDLNQKGIVGTVRTENPHGGVARQRFLATGPLAFLPLPETNACSIVWSADTKRADELLALTETDFIAQLQAAFGEGLGKILSVGPRAAFALALAHARHYTAARVALVGDAAHTVHPLAGQGVNLGFLDAAALSEVLRAAAARRRDPGEHAVLRRYERLRKGDNLAMIALTGGLRFVFGNSWPLVRGLRNAGLDLTDRAAPLKHFLMRRASGLVGDLPALARAPGA